MALSDVCELSLLDCKTLRRVLAEQFVQLEAAEPDAADE